MSVRTTMQVLITRTRQMINDQSGTDQCFTDQEIQDCLDERRADVINGSMESYPTFSVSTVQYLNYFADGNWEDDYVLKEYMTITVTPSSVEPITGKFTFSSSVFPPVYITGKNYDLFGSAADLLERQQAKWMLAYNFSASGSNFQRGQVVQNIAMLVKQYRMKQRAGSIRMVRSDVNDGLDVQNPLAPTWRDYM